MRLKQSEKKAKGQKEEAAKEAKGGVSQGCDKEFYFIPKHQESSEGL